MSRTNRDNAAMKAQLTIRDLLWFVLVCGLAVGGWLERAQLNRDHERALVIVQAELDELRQQLADPASSLDLEVIQGTWFRTSFTIGGVVQEESPDEGKIIIRGTHLQFPTPEDSWTIALDPTKTPKWFDYQGNIPRLNYDLLSSNADVINRGIYRLEGDTLTICTVPGGGKQYRPKNFESKGGTVHLQIYKRQKT
jgi:uncharacterized protein (TIGR03067 family)